MINEKKLYEEIVEYLNCRVEYVNKLQGILQCYLSLYDTDVSI